MKKFYAISIITLFAFILAGCSSPETPAPDSAPECQTPEYIKALNRNAVKQIARVKGENAKLLIALDPVLSSPEFQYEGYRDEHFINEMKHRRALLAETEVDEVIIWQFSKRNSLGVAMPFHKGCAVKDISGEPDLLAKLMRMHNTYLLISKSGLDDPSVKKSIKEVLMHSRYKSRYNDEMVDAMIETIQQVMGQ